MCLDALLCALCLRVHVGGPAFQPVCVIASVTATALRRRRCIPSSLWDDNKSFLTAFWPVTHMGGGGAEASGEESCTAPPSTSTLPFFFFFVPVIVTSLPVVVGQQPGDLQCILSECVNVFAVTQEMIVRWRVTSVQTGWGTPRGTADTFRRPSCIWAWTPSSLRMYHWRWT